MILSPSTLIRTLALATAGSLVAVGVLISAPSQAASHHGLAAQKHCTLPTAGERFQTATPAQEDLTKADVTKAVDQLSVRLRLSVQVFRNNCLVAGDPLDAFTDAAHNNLWSVTKSVTSLLTGIAIGEGRIGIDDPIGDYLPTGAGWGDAAHRALTVRKLLTQTSGIDEAILSEAATTGTDVNLAQEALAQPIEHTPGTHFEYSQLGPALLAYVVQRAVGENLQRFAQRVLFTPVGITSGSYLWLEDRSGTPYGYSNLFLTPVQLARLGLLVQNGGRWRGHQVVPASYVAQLGVPTKTNGCYGLLYWTNGGEPCTGANIPSAQTVDRRAIPTAPDDAFEMNGTGGQLNVMIPSLHMTVTTTGYFGDTYPDPSILVGATPGDMQYNFFRTLMKGVQDVHVHDPGPYPGDPIDMDVNPMNYLDPQVLLHDLVSSPTCNIVVCDGTVPTQGLLDDLHELPGLL